jgi:hypothetical protein
MDYTTEVAMENKFDKVPLDDDTTIIVQVTTEIAGFDALYQRWLWDGVTAESLIFVSDEVAALSDDELIRIVQSSPLWRDQSEVTVKRSASDYTFLTFNAEAN